MRQEGERELDPVTVVLPKGKLLSDSMKLLRRAGLDINLDEDSRQLVWTDETRGMRYVLARAADVPTYVDYGAADLGIVGKDTLLEEEREVYELLDLGFGRCRFVVAVPGSRLGQEPWPGNGRLRVATKFPRVASSFFASKGIPAEIIRLHGAVELAPRLGLAELIVDIVSTGRTLRENQLVEIETIASASARLVANRASFRLKHERVRDLLDRIKAAVGQGGRSDHDEAFQVAPGSAEPGCGVSTG